MPKERQGGYRKPATSKVGLSTPQDFLKHVVDPDMAEFSKPDQAELRLAYHSCNSLLALRDWVYETHKNTRWKYQSKTFGPIKSKTTFLKDLCSIEPDFKIIADIANASKHMVLDTTHRLTPLYGSSNVYIETNSSGVTPPMNTAPKFRVFVQIGNNFLDVLPCAQKVHKVWKALFKQNGW
jgi:hypothetical protein